MRRACANGGTIGVPFAARRAACSTSRGTLFRGCICAEASTIPHPVSSSFWPFLRNTGRYVMEYFSLSCYSHYGFIA